MINKIHIIFLFTVISFVSCNAHSKKLTVLIITGQNNHNWELTSNTVKIIYNNSGLFEATILKTPATGEEMATFQPIFKGYDLICLDYNGDDWPEQTQKRFANYVNNGGGLVVFHATNNSFPKWKAFNQMIGVGGWKGRNEKDGPILYWDDGKIKKDYTPGNAGAHGHPLKYLVHTRAPKHPIMKGIPKRWLHTKDELYHSLRGPAKNVTVLATGQQDKSKNGSGRQEPILMTITYGKGRVFHSTMGHIWKNSSNIDPIMCIGFITTILRGSEWVATGKVKQKMPKDFPTALKTKLKVIEY